MKCEYLQIAVDCCYCVTWCWWFYTHHSVNAQMQ